MSEIKCETCEYDEVCFTPLKTLQRAFKNVCKQGRKRTIRTGVRKVGIDPAVKNESARNP